MPAFDPRAFVFVSAVIAALCSAVMFALSRSLPAPARGAREWSAACALGFIAALLLVLRGTVPDFISIVVANVCLSSCLLMICLALLRFADRRPIWQLMFAGLLASALISTWYTLVMKDFLMRVFLLAVLHSLILGSCTYIVIRLSPRTSAERFMAGALGLITLVTIARAVAVLTGYDDASALNQPALLQQIYHVVFSLSVVSMTLGFILMLGNRVQASLSYLATHDSLTGGAFSRGVFFDLLGKELSRSRRSGEPVALMVIEIDDFEKINATWGKQTGERVITDFTQIARAALREYDLIGRYGPHEFLVILPGAPLLAAAGVAERIRTRCASSKGAGRPTYTVTIGLSSSVTDGDSTEMLVGRADKALFLAKSGNREQADSQSDDPADRPAS